MHEIASREANFEFKPGSFVKMTLALQEGGLECNFVRVPKENSLKVNIAEFRSSYVVSLVCGGSKIVKQFSRDVFRVVTVNEVLEKSQRRQLTA